jgi:apolipoprotein N-acyltransferase
VLTESSSQAVESPRGGWLRARRNRLALWIAAAEGLIVALSHDLTKWTVVALAVLAGLVWTFARNHSSSVVRQVLWIFVVSQLLATVLVLFAVFFKWLVILGLVAFAVIGLAILYFDRR